MTLTVEEAALLAAQIAQLDAQIASGVSSVSYGSKRVENRSLLELRQARDLLADKLLGVPSIRTVRARSRGDKGL